MLQAIIKDILSFATRTRKPWFRRRQDSVDLVFGLAAVLAVVVPTGEIEAGRMTWSSQNETNPDSTGANRGNRDGILVAPLPPVELKTRPYCVSRIIDYPVTHEDIESSSFTDPGFCSAVAAGSVDLRRGIVHEH